MKLKLIKLVAVVWMSIFGSCLCSCDNGVLNTVVLDVPADAGEADEQPSWDELPQKCEIVSDFLYGECSLSTESLIEVVESCRLVNHVFILPFFDAYADCLTWYKCTLYENGPFVESEPYNYCMVGMVEGFPRGPFTRVFVDHLCEFMVGCKLSGSMDECRIDQELRRDIQIINLMRIEILEQLDACVFPGRECNFDFAGCMNGVVEQWGITQVLENM